MHLHNQFGTKGLLLEGVLFMKERERLSMLNSYAKYSEKTEIG